MLEGGGCIKRKVLITMEMCESERGIKGLNAGWDVIILIIIIIIFYFKFLFFPNDCHGVAHLRPDPTLPTRWEAGGIINPHVTMLECPLMVGAASRLVSHVADI